MGFVRAGQRPGEMRTESPVEHRVLAGRLDVPEGPEERTAAIGRGRAPEPVRSRADLDRDVDAVLGGEEGTRLQGPVDRVTGGGALPAFVAGLEEPGPRPPQQGVGGAEVAHADGIVE